MTTVSAEVTGRGQVTIPKSVRDKYGLANGAKIRIVDMDGSIVIVPQETELKIDRMHANFDTVREHLVATDANLDDMMATLRQVREGGA